MNTPKAEITFPRVTRDLLIFPPSFNLTPVAPVASALSLPARSTRCILLTVSHGISASNLAYRKTKKTVGKKMYSIFLLLLSGVET